jgi:septal ring factor EnvC (AmiA/AmiB activator)
VQTSSTILQFTVPVTAYAAFLMCYNRRNSIRVRSAREGGMDDLTQVTQMINWLESERRKDKAALATLEQKASGLANELAEQTRRVQELQTALTATQLALSKLPQFEKILEQFKTDLIGEMDRRDDAQQNSRGRTAAQSRSNPLPIITGSQGTASYQAAGRRAPHAPR